MGKGRVTRVGKPLCPVWCVAPHDYPTNPQSRLTRYERAVPLQLSLRGREDRGGTLVDLRYTYGRGRGLVLGLRCSAPGCGAGRRRSWCGGLALGLGMCTGHGTGPLWVLE